MRPPGSHIPDPTCLRAGSRGGGIPHILTRSVVSGVGNLQGHLLSLTTYIEKSKKVRLFLIL